MILPPVPMRRVLLDDGNNVSMFVDQLITRYRLKMSAEKDTDPRQVHRTSFAEVPDTRIPVLGLSAQDAPT